MRARLGSLGLIFTSCLLIVGLVPVIFYALVLHHTTTVGLTELKERDVADKMATCLNYFAHVSADQALQARDYANWDETYEQVVLKDPEWFKTNLDGWLVKDFGVGFVILLDQHNQVVHAAGSAKDNPTGFLASLQPLQDRFFQDRNPAGLLRVNGHTHLVAASSVFNSDGSGPPRGKLLIGTPIVPYYLEQMTSLYGIPVQFFDDEESILDVAAERTVLPKAPGETAVFYDDSWIYAVQMLPDLSGNILGYVMISQEQKSLLLTRQSITKAAVSTMLFTIVLITFLSILSLRITTDPIVRLEKSLSRMREQKRFTMLPDTGPKEVSSLARTFNALANTLTDTIAEREALYRRMAQTDGLTGLPNRRYYHEHLAELLDQAREEGKPLTIALIELNYLAHYINRFGLEQGDTLVKEVADLLSVEQAPDQVFCRFGDGIFAVIMYKKDHKRALSAIYKLVERLEKTQYEGRQALPGGRVSFSYGLASYPEETQTTAGLNRIANGQLFEMKQLGPNRLLHYLSFFEDFTATPEASGRIQEISRIFIKLIDSMDNYTANHTHRVVEYSAAIARHLGWKEHDLERLKTAALMHDIGKIQVGGAILQKEGVLTPKEWEIMRQHPRWGAEMVRAVTGMEDIAYWIECHHERYDGTGYPTGVAGEAIPMGARIITVADSFDAMTTNRPYHEARTLDDVVQELYRCAGTQFDPTVVEALVSIIKNRASESRVAESS